MGESVEGPVVIVGQQYCQLCILEEFLGSGGYAVEQDGFKREWQGRKLGNL